MQTDELNSVIVRAKAATYVGNGTPAKSSRLGSHDLTWIEGDWLYLGSYFGGTDFIGQETLWFSGEPIWAMSYYGYILLPGLIDAPRAGATIKEARSSLYHQGRFLGGFEWYGEHGKYVDHNDGDASPFRGRETILVKGLIRDLPN